MIYSLPRSMSGTTIPLVAFDDGREHLEFEFFNDRIEVFYLDRNGDKTYESSLKFNDKLKSLVVNGNKTKNEI